MTQGINLTVTITTFGKHINLDREKQLVNSILKSLLSHLLLPPLSPQPLLPPVPPL